MTVDNGIRMYVATLVTNLTVRLNFPTLGQTFPTRFLTAVMLFWYEMQKVLYDSISNFLKTNLKLYLIFLKR